MEINTNPDEFIKFHRLLTANNPEYEPFYFPLERNGKDPVGGISWKKNRRTYEQAVEALRNGYNIGIAGTDNDRLVIVDVDDIEVVGDIKPTLINQSRKRIGRHGFYFTDDEIAKDIFDNSAKQNIATEDAGEVRSNWQYVVAAGSYVPCAPEEIERIPLADRNRAGMYTVMIEHTVNTITYEELPDAYRICLQGKREAQIAANNRKEKKKKPTHDHNNKSALWDLDISDVIGKSDNPSFRFPSPFHGSKTYKDTSINHGLLHCWRHNVSHNALTALATLSGYSTCSEAGIGHNAGGCSAIDFTDGETVYTIWKYAKEHGIIPDNDPIPAKALAHYATKEGYCNQSDIKDGWQIPINTYNEVIKTKEFVSGREEIKDRRIENNIKESISNPMDIAVALQDSNPIWFDKSRNIWMWDNTLQIYERIDETDVLCQISNVINVTEIYKSNVKNEIMESIRITGRMRNVQEPVNTWIQFHNCVVDIETFDTFPATPNYFFAARIPHDYGKSDKTPTIDKLFTDWVGDKWKQTLYEICAYCLYDGYPIHRIFTLLGTGRNGKGQFMTLLKRFIGVDNCISTDLDRIANSRFETAKMYKRKAAFIGETNFNTLSRTNTLKSLSGGDVVPGEFKGKDSFDFVNTAKIVIATNALPDTTDKTDGFYRRWLIIDFCNKFPEGRDIINEIPEYEYENLANKCVHILSDLLSSGKFANEGSVSDRAAIYEAKSNPLSKFIEDNCIIDINSTIPHWYLKEKYQEHCQTYGYRIINKNEFNALIKTAYTIEPQHKFTSAEADMYRTTPDNKPANWQAISGIGWNFDKEVGLVGKGRQTFPDENDCSGDENEKGRLGRHKSHSISTHIQPSENMPTKPTKPTFVASDSENDFLKGSQGRQTNSSIVYNVEKWCIDWENIMQTSINSSNVVKVAMEYAKKHNCNNVDELVEIVKRWAKIL